MEEVIGVKFKAMGKIYYFDPDGGQLKRGDYVIVETARGIECGEVAMENRMIESEEIVKPLKKLIRIATDTDIEIMRKNRKKEEQAAEIFEEKVAYRQLEMKLVDVEYTFDGSKILFYYTAPSRVDFRELVKDLASVFRARIELRQIGVRDESKMLGGMGICGRPFCCKQFLTEFQPVSIKMAKEQGLSMNTSKISGACGRLMCCLKYEQDSYEHLLRHTPKIGAIVETKQGRGTVTDMNLLTGMLTIKLDKNPEGSPLVIERHQVKLIKDAQINVSKDELDALKGIQD
ncbi:MAG: stage 0 sporulation family protein [Clostridiales bacterium]|nr:stage 0 sporulation family protein [Clostridiales bacterium]MCD7828243.1 stage 0 sporulation family protein [Clostridiales bacterium]